MTRMRRGLGAAGLAPSVRAEGYELAAGPGGVIVAGHDPAGTFYGAQTLCQMLGRDAGGVYVSGARIHDYPSLGWRGAGFGPIIGAPWFETGNIQSFSGKLAAGRERGLLETTWAGFNSSEANLTHQKRQFVAFVLAAEYAWNGGSNGGPLPYAPAQVFDRLYGTSGR